MSANVETSKYLKRSSPKHPKVIHSARDCVKVGQQLLSGPVVSAKPTTWNFWIGQYDLEGIVGLAESMLELRTAGMKQAFFVEGLSLQYLIFRIFSKDPTQPVEMLLISNLITWVGAIPEGCFLKGKDLWQLGGIWLLLQKSLIFFGTGLVGQ